MKFVKRTLALTLFCVSTQLSAFPDTNGWIFGIVDKAHKHSNMSPYFSDYAIKEMYAQRDYFKASVVGNLMTEVYDHWNHIKINTETAVMYESFLRNYNKKVFTLMYASDAGMEHEIFVDDQMLATVHQIVGYHTKNSNNAEFKRFLVDVSNTAVMLHGKTIKESRMTLFPDTGTCTPAQISAGFC